MATDEIARYLTLNDLDRIVQIENDTWIPPLRASREKIKYRLENGHRYLGYDVNGILTAMVGWSYQFIRSPQELPADFATFSSGKSVLEESNVAFIYNVGVGRQFRKQGIGSKVVQEAFKKIFEDGVKEIYLDGRCSSYNGSTEYPDIEYVEQQSEYKKRIDACMKEDKVPTVDDVMFDPTLRFYARLGFTPVRLSANFLSADKPSGGFRVIMYKKFD